jgi:hypothetical protein
MFLISIGGFQSIFNKGVHLHHLIDSCDNLKYESTDYVQVIILKQFYLSQFILFYLLSHPGPHFALKRFVRKIGIYYFPAF